MDMEDRVERLTAAMLELSGRAFVVDVLLDTLIATHPMPKQVADLFEHMLSTQTHQLLDEGFDRNASIAGSQAVQRAVAMFADHYLRRVRLAAGEIPLSDS